MRMFKTIIQFTAIITACCFFLASCGGTRIVREEVPTGEVMVWHPVPSVPREPYIDKGKIETKDLTIQVPLAVKVYSEECLVNEFLLKEIQKKNPHVGNIIVGIPLLAVFTYGIGLVGFLFDSELRTNYFGGTVSEQDIETIEKNVRPTGNKDWKDVPFAKGLLKVEAFGKEREYIADEQGMAIIDLVEAAKDWLEIPDALSLKLSVEADGNRDETEFPLDGALLSALEAKTLEMASGSPRLAPYPVSEAEFVRNKDLEFACGDSDSLLVKVTNKGKGANYQLKGQLHSENPLFDGRKLLFGKVSPGQTRKARYPFVIPETELTGEIPIRISFTEQNGYVPEDIILKVSIRGKVPPRFSYGFQVMDDGSGNSVGNGDGRISPRESFDLVMSVKNEGGAAAERVKAWVDTSYRVPGLVFNVKEASLGDLPPGGVARAQFTMTAQPHFSQRAISINFHVSEELFGTKLDDTLYLPMGEAIKPKIITIHKQILTQSGAKIHSGLGEDTSVFGTMAAGGGLLAVGETEDWYKVELDDGSSGWLRKTDTSLSVAKEKPQEKPKEPAAKAAIVRMFEKSKPVISLIDPGSDTIEVTLPTIGLSGVVVDNQGLSSVQVFLNGRLFNTANQKGVAIVSRKNSEVKEQQLHMEIPLALGENNIRIWASNIVGMQTEKRILVRRTKEKGNIFAVVIGISDYKSTRDLEYADDDARAVRDYFVHHLGVSRENVFTLIDRDATVLGMRTLLGTTLPSKVGKKDTVFVYFGGHGVAESNAVSPDGDGLSKYLLASDSDISNLYGSALPMEEVSRIFGRLRAERVLFLLDTCYSGASGGRTLASNYKSANLADGFLARVAQGKGRVILCASEPNEVAHESDKLGHGVFTYHLLQGMRGKADHDRDGIVSIHEAYRYVSEKVPRETNQTQHPIMKGSMEGIVVMGRSWANQ